MNLCQPRRNRNKSNTIIQTESDNSTTQGTQSHNKGTTNSSAATDSHRVHREFRKTIEPEVQLQY